MFFAFRKLMILTIIFNFFSFNIYAQKTFLRLDKKSLISFSKNALRFENKGSNGVSYKVGLSCFTANRTSNNYAEGSLRVLRSEFQVGADVSFSYPECLEIREALQEGREQLLLSWNQEDFEAFISAELSFKRIVNEVDLVE